MSIAVKATIKYDPDVKPSQPHYVLECKSPFLVASGSGNIEEMIEDLTTGIREKISEEFGRDSYIEVISYTISLTFGVQGIVNHSLSEYEGTIKIGDGEATPLVNLGRAEVLLQKMHDRAEKTGKTMEEVFQEAQAELERRKQAKEES